MKISHLNKNINKVSFILTNKSGGFTFMSNKPESRYQGVFFNINGKLFKIIEDIATLGEIKEIKNNLSTIERKKEDLTEKYFMPNNFNSIVYGLDKLQPVEIILDVKGIYDNREFGRFYDIKKTNNKIVIKFTKKTNISEDESDDQKEYEIYIAIKADNPDFHTINQWVKHDYPKDKERNSGPFERYAYSAIKLKETKKIVISVSIERDKAIKEADYIYNNADKLESKQIINKRSNDEASLAYSSASYNINQLTINNSKNIIAGIPWFFQFWSRDELISVKALKDPIVIKKILLKYISQLGKGDLPNYLNGEINAADAIGWLSFRLSDLLKKVKFSKKEISSIKNKLEKSIDILLNTKTKDALAINYEKETWMDSLQRDGARIEIQALRLASYRLLYNLTKNQKYKKLETELKNKVREKFWNGEYLCDGLDNPTIRPNFFIAAYIYPELLSNADWIRCIDHCLPKLWLGFGLSTIDKNDPRFINQHTGEDPKSYHNGDSWYWINNLSAIVMHRMDKLRFKSNINSILKASTEEILWMGAIGHHSEVSSAMEQRSEGCLSQAWSNAMYVELIDEVRL